MEVTYPGGCDTNLQRFEFLTSLREKLRLLYNLMSLWASTGITEVKYNNLPQRIKDRYPYVAVLSGADFTDFVELVFKKAEKPIHNAIEDARAGYITELKGQYLESTTFSPDLEEHIGL